MQMSENISQLPWKRLWLSFLPFYRRCKTVALFIAYLIFYFNWNYFTKQIMYAVLYIIYLPLIHKVLMFYYLYVTTRSIFKQNLFSDFCKFRLKIHLIFNVFYIIIIARPHFDVLYNGFSDPEYAFLPWHFKVVGLWCINGRYLFCLSLFLKEIYILKHFFSMFGSPFPC